MDVARALVADVGRVPKVLHDLAPAEDPLRILGEQEQQLELRRREPLRLASDPHLVPDRVELESAVGTGTTVRFRFPQGASLVAE